MAPPDWDGTCSLRGHSSFIARQQGQTISFVLSGLNLSANSQKVTMKDCGGASAGCWGLISGTSTPMKLPRCSFSLGGLGLRSATRTRQAAYWASWADCLSMIKVRHPRWQRGSWSHYTVLKERSRSEVQPWQPTNWQGVEGFEVPSWESLSEGARPEFRKPEDHEPGGVDMVGSMKQRPGWNVTIGKHNLMVRLAPHEKGSCTFPKWARRFRWLLRTSGPASTLPCSVCSSCDVSVSRPLSFHACADVAVHWIPLATIARRVPELACWAGEALLLRAQLRGYAGKRGDV